MRHFAPAIAVAACVLTACTDLPPLGECGNGVVEATGGEDCDDPDSTRCLGCRLVCDLDLPADGACPDGARCCLAGQTCGHDQLCRAPSGLFAPPTGFFPFPATQLAIADVDLDGIGDAFGVNRQQASFVYGAVGIPTRQASAPIPTQSRPDSQAIFASLDFGPEGLSAPAVVVATPRGFAVLLAQGSRTFSPPLPEIDLEEEAGGGVERDHGLAVSPATSGELIALVAERRSDTGGTDRIALRVFRDFAALPTPDDVCGVDLTSPANAEGLSIYADVRRADAPLGEQAIVAVTQVVAPPGGSVSVTAAMCAYTGLPIEGAPIAPTTLALPAGLFPVAMRTAQLDADSCPEVVAEVRDVAGNVDEVLYWNPDGIDCAVAGSGSVASGHLIGTGDLDGDGREEVMVDRLAYTSILLPVGAGPVPGLFLPEALDAAVVVDVNRDGRPDIAAVTADQPDLVVILRVDAGWAPRTVASVGPLRELVAADFDGDTYPDLATVEASAADVPRVVVAFGGPTGPQALDSIGPIHGARGLVAHVDRIPFASSDAFADLLMIDDAENSDEVSQFNGAATRALTAQIDLTGPPPAGDNGITFGRTVATGELVPPRGDLSDFCVVSFAVLATPGGGLLSQAFAFCAGGQGNEFAGGAIDDDGAFSADGDTIDPDEPLPLVAGADVSSPTGGEPIGVLVALRRDVPDVPELIVITPPPAFENPGERVPTARLTGLFTLAPAPPAYVRFVIPAGLHALELDGDADSELIVSLYDYAYDPNDEQGTAIFTAYLFRVDLATGGGTVTATAAPLVEPELGVCSDAARVELGDAMPDGTPAAPGLELVVLCSDQLLGFYRGADGAMHPPFPIGSADGAFGPIAIGDLTGDRLDDISILVGNDRDAYLVIMPQCPAHDTAACSTFVADDF